VEEVMTTKRWNARGARLVAPKPRRALVPELRSEYLAKGRIVGAPTQFHQCRLSHATQNVTATFAFMQKLSQAKNFQDVIKIQTEFMNAQLNSFNDQAKIIGEIYTKAATAVAKTPPR
jgi:hypothetical protein